MDHQQKTSLRFVSRARDFLKKIGMPIEVVPSYIPDPADTFFKGVWIANGKLHFCPARVQVGELLHEAGHMALMPKSQWGDLPTGRWKDDSLYPPLGGFKYLGDAAVEAWDYAAALAADIPELCVFVNGFNGNGLVVWELFDRRKHPGFTLLRFLGMSSAWGRCDRWFVGNTSIEDSREEMERLMMSCSPQERKDLLVAFEFLLKN